MDIYLSDESRRKGFADSICFPKTEQELCLILRSQPEVPVTIQGSRTGLTAGAVPRGGLALNLSSMNRFPLIPGAESLSDTSAKSDAGTVAPSGANVHPAAISQSVAVEPGVLLCDLQKSLSHAGLFFPPDPTETTASIGGMISCNSSGARSYQYGATRGYIQAIDLVLSDGDTLRLRRGDCLAKAGRFRIVTDQGRIISGQLPQIQMPKVSKHTAGYYIHPEMDILDLFIGSEGTLGIVTRAELSVLPLPRERWGILCFFSSEASALRFVHLLRGDIAPSSVSGRLHRAELYSSPDLPLEPDAIEFFGTDTIVMLRDAQTRGNLLQELPRGFCGCAVYIEFSSDDRKLLEDHCRRLGQLLSLAGGDPRQTWFAFHGPDMQRLKDFRHAAPVCVNERISEIRTRYPDITKLGTDMSVPDDRLEEVFAMYRSGLADQGFQSSLFGHIGNNHLHCNIIPRNPEEYARGKDLYSHWAREVVRMGGSVSAEHGIGKLKTWLLRTQYNEKTLQSMLDLKRLFDPMMRLNSGNIFG